MNYAPECSLDWLMADSPLVSVTLLQLMGWSRHQTYAASALLTSKWLQFCSSTHSVSRFIRNALLNDCGFISCIFYFVSVHERCHMESIDTDSLNDNERLTIIISRKDISYLLYSPLLSRSSCWWCCRGHSEWLCTRAQTCPSPRRQCWSSTGPASPSGTRTASARDIAL